MTLKDRIRAYEKKHCITEDVEPELVPETKKDVKPPVPTSELVTGISTTISTLIQDEWQTIDAYNNAITMLETLEGVEDLVTLLKEPLADEYNHVGVLEKALSMITPALSEIDAGKEEAEEELSK